MRLYHLVPVLVLLFATAAECSLIEPHGPDDHFVNLTGTLKNVTNFNDRHHLRSSVSVGAPAPAAPSRLSSNKSSSSNKSASESFHHDFALRDYVQPELQIAVSALVGTVPDIGPLLAGLVGLFWPQSSTDLWTQIKTAVQELIRSDELESKFNSLKLTFDTIKSAFATISANLVTSALSTNFIRIVEQPDYIDINIRGQICNNDGSVVDFNYLPLIAPTMMLHMSSLRTLYQAQYMLKDSGIRDTAQRLNNVYGMYYTCVNDAFTQWKAWRPRYLHCDYTDDDFHRDGYYQNTGHVYDDLTGQTYFDQTNHDHGSSYRDEVAQVCQATLNQFITQMSQQTVQSHLVAAASSLLVSGTPSFPTPNVMVASQSGTGTSVAQIQQVTYVCTATANSIIIRGSPTPSDGISFTWTDVWTASAVALDTPALSRISDTQLQVLYVDANSHKLIWLELVLTAPDASGAVVQRNALGYLFTGPVFNGPQYSAIALNHGVNVITYNGFQYMSFISPANNNAICVARGNQQVYHLPDAAVVCSAAAAATTPGLVVYNNRVFCPYTWTDSQLYIVQVMDTGGNPIASSWGALSVSTNGITAPTGFVYHSKLYVAYRGADNGFYYKQCTNCNNITIDNGNAQYQWSETYSVPNVGLGSALSVSTSLDTSLDGELTFAFTGTDTNSWVIMSSLNFYTSCKYVSGQGTAWCPSSYQLVSGGGACRQDWDEMFLSLGPVSSGNTWGYSGTCMNHHNSGITHPADVNAVCCPSFNGMIDGCELINGNDVGSITCPANKVLVNGGAHCHQDWDQLLQENTPVTNGNDPPTTFKATCMNHDDSNRRNPPANIWAQCCNQNSVSYKLQQNGGTGSVTCPLDSIMGPTGASCEPGWDQMVQRQSPGWTTRFSFQCMNHHNSGIVNDPTSVVSYCLTPITQLAACPFSSGDVVVLQSWKSDYLYRPDTPIGDANVITTESDSTATGIKWTIEMSDDSQCKIHLRSWKGDYLHRPDSSGGVTIWYSGAIGDEWIVRRNDASSYILQSWKNDYLNRPDTTVQGVTTSGFPSISDNWVISKPPL